MVKRRKFEQNSGFFLFTGCAVLTVAACRLWMTEKLIERWDAPVWGHPFLLIKNTPDVAAGGAACRSIRRRCNQNRTY